MIICAEKQKKMLEAATPLMKWLSENCHPHCVLIVSGDTVELLEGIAMSRLLDEKK